MSDTSHTELFRMTGRKERVAKTTFYQGLQPYQQSGYVQDTFEATSLCKSAMLVYYVSLCKSAMSVYVNPLCQFM